MKLTHLWYGKLPKHISEVPLYLLSMQKNKGSSLQLKLECELKALKAQLEVRSTKALCRQAEATQSALDQLLTQKT